MNDYERQAGPADAGAGDSQASRGDAAPRGGVGGQSGTGQAQPHRGLEDRAKATQRTSSPVGLGDETDAATYQSGGTQQNRAQREQEAKQREGGAGVAKSPQGGADPAPGAAAGRGPR